MHRLLSQRRVVMEVADELSAQRPDVIHVFLDGLRRKVRGRQAFEEGTEQDQQLFARGQIFFQPIHERGQPLRSRQ